MPCALCLELQNRARHLIDDQRSNPLGGLVQQHQTALAQIVAIKLQSQWSACIEDRAVSGHWEGDLLFGDAYSQIAASEGTPKATFWLGAEM